MVQSGLRPRPSGRPKLEKPKLASASDEIEGAQVLRSYFKNLAVRDFDEIFDNENDVINRVLKPSKQRYFAAVMLVIGICLNSFTITKGFLWSVDDQRELYHVFSDHTFMSNFSECRQSKKREMLQRRTGEEHRHGFEDGAEHWQQGCGHIKKHSQHLFVCLPAFWEIFMVLQTLMRSLFFLRHVRQMGQRSIQQLSEDHAHRHKMMDEFKTINHGIEILDGMTAISSIKRLPIVQKLVPDLMLQHNLMRERLGTDGQLSMLDLCVIFANDFGRLSFYLVQVAFAMIALYLKLIGITHLLEEEFIFWNRGEWLAFVGFMFQIANLVKLKKEKKDAFLFFVFTGEDAKMQDQEREALDEFCALMVKKLFQKLGAYRGFAMALTITSEDLQRIVLTENANTESSAFDRDLTT